MSQGRLSPGKGHDPGQSGKSFGTVVSVTPQAVGAWVQQPPVLPGLGRPLTLVNKSKALKTNMPQVTCEF